MNIIDLVLIGLSLAMDAFALSIVISMNNIRSIRLSLKVATYFSVFQVLMPYLGYFLGTYFRLFIESIDHWVIFILLSYLSVKMIKDAICKEEKVNSIDLIGMLIMSLASSIDAFSIGISFSLLNVNLLLSTLIIGTITFVLCFMGTFFGKIISFNSSRHYQIFGALILFTIGIKILFEHLKII